MNNVQCVALNKVIRPSLDALMPPVCLWLTQKQGQASGLIRQLKWQLAHCTLMNVAVIIGGGPSYGEGVAWLVGGSPINDYFTVKLGLSHE